MSKVQTQRHFGVIGLLLLLALPALGREAIMEQELPVYDRFRCALCHTNGVPTSSDLNPFGLDYLEFGPWGPELASMDSDGDGCDNGAELGDIDGNGQADDGVTQESSNPGLEGDCSSAFTEELSWGELKAIFDGQR